MSFVNTINFSSFPSDGSYVDEEIAPAITSAGPNTSVIGIVGPGSWGKLNVPMPFSQPTADGYNTFGRDTTAANSLISEAQLAYPECTSFVGVRVDDGTGLAATAVLLDSAAPTPGQVLDFTAACTGTDGNLMTARLDLQSGTALAKPVYQITMTSPFENARIYRGIVGYAVAAYDAATFKANALAVINGSAPNSVRNPNAVVAAGSSTAAPQTGVTVTFSGGTNGDAGVTTETLIGTDGTVNRTGLFALRGACPGGQVMLAACSDPLAFPVLAAFARSENCLTGMNVGPAGTTADEAVDTQLASALRDDYVVLAMDYDYFYDPSQKLQRLVSPLGKVMGIVASRGWYEDVENKPEKGAVGVSATERTVEGPLSKAERGERQNAGIQYLTNPIDGGSVWGLNHGLTSSGANISDVRAANFIGLSIQQIGGKFIGTTQTASVNDATRRNYRNELKRFFQNLLSLGQIAGYLVVADTTDNSATTVAQGLLDSEDFVTTLAGVKIALAQLQVGTTVDTSAGVTA